MVQSKEGDSGTNRETNICLHSDMAGDTGLQDREREERRREGEMRKRDVTLREEGGLIIFSGGLFTSGE